MAARLSVNQISKVFDGRRGAEPLKVLDRIQFEAEPGEFISIIGPSGCGKTTLMRIVHGLEAPTQGNVTFDGAKVSAPDRQRAVVFQHFNLFPWRTVQQNIAFGLEARKDSSAQIAARV